MQVLNVEIAIMLLMSTGAVCAWRRAGVLERASALPVLNKLLFKITLPASVVLGLGLQTNLYGERCCATA